MMSLIYNNTLKLRMPKSSPTITPSPPPAIQITAASPTYEDAHLPKDAFIMYTYIYI